MKIIIYHKNSKRLKYFIPSNVFIRLITLISLYKAKKNNKLLIWLFKEPKIKMRNIYKI